MYAVFRNSLEYYLGYHFYFCSDKNEALLLKSIIESFFLIKTPFL